MTQSNEKNVRKIFSIAKIESSFSWPMVDLCNFWMRFKAENDRSAVQLVPGIVRKRQREECKLGKTE